MPEWKQQKNKKNPVIAITFLSMVTAVYVIFCGIQVVFLFTGGMLLLCSDCTYIMIASSVLRMILYISTYHLSFLRVLVLWFLAMLTVLMAGVVITVLRPEFGLFRYCMTVVTVFYLIFSFGRSDYFIAKYNVAQMGEEISFEDLEYHHVLESTEDMNVRTFHLSKYLAGQAAQEYFGR